MNPLEHQPIPKPDALIDEIDVDEGASVDDFIKELEAKEKDLHITADMRIEIEEPDFDASGVQDVVERDIERSVTLQRAAATPNGRPQPGMKTRVFELQNEVDALNDRIRGLRGERNEIQEKSDRRLKDFENYKYRMDRERRGAFIDQITNLASQMLPVLDNLGRALDSVDKKMREQSDEFLQFYDGIALVNQQLSEIFTEMGVQPIATVGEAFDPNFHEAVAVETREGTPPNMVLEEMLRGYRIGNRVIRHSMVKVTAAPANRPIGTPAVAEQSESMPAEDTDGTDASATEAS